MAEDIDHTQRLERRAGLLLMAAAAAALLVANSPLREGYEAFLHLKFGPSLPRLGVLDVHYWVADGLMAIFFLLVGLEVKREWYEGRLSTPAERRLPIIAAVAGMAVPALVYLAITGGEPALTNGWAIPAATDIAFAVGILALLGKRAPPSVKLLLVTLAIVDDIGAVAIIALFYTADLNVPALAGAIAVTIGMAALGQFGVRRLWPFMLGFAILWLLTLASGVHATIAGVLAALTIPLGRGDGHSPLTKLEHAIHPWVMLGIVPLFGFVSAGVALTGGIGTLTEPLPLAVMAGLFIGKQVGVLGAVWLAVKGRLAPMPACTTWRHIHGAALLCGIGFTMSLFIGALAFPGDAERIDAAKIGILAGSLLSAIGGWAMLRFAPIMEGNAEDDEEVGELFGADER
ncbi:Na+/H+ antiporter NhaA [Sphingomonas sp. LY160]|uniref:Na+/H+ antiporter NhaA n=1 Tax=Sphingomonas sp. LY160 TaxID=3095342 RepID=UPI002ADEE0B6|nr:Na+/H+ antiporter NhaA [Sphingomonas sp. LY160]MEA1072603.1 Na+/H+ antiporter NhaA [Sphingomonas sp. LY160]